MLIISIPAYIIGVQYGLAIMLYTRIVIVLTEIIIQSYLCSRILNVSPLYLWYDGKRFFVAVLVMLFIVKILGISIVLITPGMYHFVKFGIMIVVGAAVYLSMIWMLDRAFVTEAVRLIRRAVANA